MEEKNANAPKSAASGTAGVGEIPKLPEQPGQAPVSNTRQAISGDLDADAIARAIKSSYSPRATGDTPISNNQQAVSGDLDVDAVARAIKSPGGEFAQAVRDAVKSLESLNAEKVTEPGQIVAPSLPQSRAIKSDDLAR
jgi:hypothetical protein